MTVYFSSDTHFNHKNILKYTNRPFSSIEEHDEGMIKNWNDTVGPEDEIYFLGDFSLGSTDNAMAALRRLHGRKHLIWGNHEVINLTTPTAFKHGVSL